MNRKEHWNRVYETKTPDDVSWHQRVPSLSLRLIAAADMAPDSGVIDVGGGASPLALHLLEAGYSNLAVLDISTAALAHAKRKVGADAAKVDWIEANITEFTSTRRFGMWHDRAVFHFLTCKEDRAKYVKAMVRTLAPNGHAIIATFALDGPAKCSGLDVAHYDATAISGELGDRFSLLAQVDESHFTPWETEQRFSYFHFLLREG